MATADRERFFKEFTVVVEGIAKNFEKEGPWQRQIEKGFLIVIQSFFFFKSSKKA